MPEPSEDAPRRPGCARRIALLLIIVGLLAVLAGVFAVGRVRVPAEDGYMAPALLPGQAAWVDKLSPRLSGSRRGDVVALRAPERPRGLVILRVVALPTETVELTAGRVYVDGAPLAESYARGAVPMTFGPTQVPRGHYFALADDRTAYRAADLPWGLVARRDIIGRVMPPG